jgi:hypothetical protein
MFFEPLEHADMRQAARAPTAEGETDAWTRRLGVLG